MLRRRIGFCCALAVFVGATSGKAHNVEIEPQALYSWPMFAPADDDYSWSNPRVLDNVVDSRAVFAYLSLLDVDVYQFTLTAEDLVEGPVLVSASALPPACWEYQWVYPVTALVGPQAAGPGSPPGLPPDDGTLALPFDVPPGLGVIKAENPWICYPDQRPIFTLDEGDLGPISWFLPSGLTQECLMTAQWQCDFSNTIAQPVFYPGTYYIVIWNPKGIPTDYTANIGYGEENYQPNPEAEALVRDNGLLHRRCHGPYPFR